MTAHNTSPSNPAGGVYLNQSNVHSVLSKSAPNGKAHRHNFKQSPLKSGPAGTADFTYKSTPPKRLSLDA
jgi:hypothetical protein